MASRESRRLRERLSGKNEEKGKEKGKINPLTVPSIIIIGLVLIGLLWWGESSSAGAAGEITFAVYDGRPIVWASGNYYARKIAEMTQFNNTIEYEQAIRLLLPYMIFHTAVLIEAEKSGIAVSEKEVEDYIIRVGARERYNNATSIERHDLFDTFQQELIELKLLETMIQPVENKNFDDFAVRTGTREKKFRFVQWTYDRYPTQEVVKYADENPDLFRRVKLTPLVTQEEGAARDARTKIIDKQSTFDEQLALLGSSQGSGTAGRDWQSFYSLGSALGGNENAAKVFSLAQGEISDVLPLGTQWVIYRCDQEPVGADLSDQKTIDEVRRYVIEFQKGRIETYFETEATAFTEKARTSSLSRQAAAGGHKVFESGFFPINYRALPFLKTIQGASEAEASLADAQYDSLFFKKTFALKSGELSAPLLLGEKVVVLELAGERDITPEELEKIKKDFSVFRNRYFTEFFYIIADRLYTRGYPTYAGQYSYQDIDIFQYHQLATQGFLQMYADQISYDVNRVFLDQRQFYQMFIDQEKLGTRTEQDKLYTEGMEKFRGLMKKQ